RAAVAEREIRKHLPQGLCDGGRIDRRAWSLLHVLRPRTNSSGPRLPDTLGGLSRRPGGLSKSNGERVPETRNVPSPSASLSRLSRFAGGPVLGVHLNVQFKCPHCEKAFRLDDS